MSFLDSLTKKSRLNSYIKQTAQARKSEGAKADHLFKTAYQGYAEIISDDPLRAQALYFWGHALLHQAKTKSGGEAAGLYQEAIEKFSFCSIIDPNYLAAAIDSGVAYMDLARLKAVAPDSELYELSKMQFERANAIQAGAASYNLACIYALRGDAEACLKALANAKDKGSLPDAGEILNDPDLGGIKSQGWFIEFMESLSEKSEAAEKETTQQLQAKTKPTVKKAPRTEEAIDSTSENAPSEKQD